MSRYRRDNTAGATWFFTVVAFERRHIFCEPAFRDALRDAIEQVRLSRPFKIDAWILLPDHLHCVWTLPEHDADFSTRWRLIKHHVTHALGATWQTPGRASASRIRRNESTIWQRRFWEHRIRDDHDFEKHVDYLHFNPVKHRVASRVIDWPHSSFHRYVANGAYPADWGGDTSTPPLPATFAEP